MRSLLLLITETLAVAVVLVPLLLLLLHLRYQNMRKTEKCMVLLLAVYLAAVFGITGMPSVTYMRIHPIFNWIPFADIMDAPASYIKNTILNVLLFLPLGMLSPLVWKRYRSWTDVLKLGFSVSLFIEMMQILTFRCSDIDDLITNSVGALVGFALVCPILGKVKSAEAENRRKTSLKESYVNKEKISFLTLTVVVFIVMFLVSPFLENFLWAGLWKHFL